MKKKLTLTIDQQVVEQAKQYAKQRHNRSIFRSRKPDSKHRVRFPLQVYGTAERLHQISRGLTVGVI